MARQVTASEFIRRSLKLINEPGRGATLHDDDLGDGLETLIEILDTEAVTEQFMPGVSRHFFPMVSGKSIYSYYDGPGADLRSDDFGSLKSGLGDPAPVNVEAAYIREGSTITDNELIPGYRFESDVGWTLDANAQIINNQFVVEASGASTASFLPINGALIATDVQIALNSIYTLRVDAIVNTGDFKIVFWSSGVEVESFTIDSTGYFEFDFTWDLLTSASGLTVRVETDTGTDDILINSLSLVERGTIDRFTLPDSQGSDYNMFIVDQAHYNRRFTKGTGGRPYNLFYTRGPNGIGDLRFDNSAITGDILIMDVLVNRTKITRLEDIMRLNTDAFMWVRYELANQLAGEYGKELTRAQMKIMDNAYDRMAAGNERWNTLGVDRALRDRPTFDINRGDP